MWYFPYVNERLDLVAGRRRDVVLADWAAVSNVGGVTYDAMHLTDEGIALAIDTILTAAGLAEPRSVLSNRPDRAGSKGRDRRIASDLNGTDREGRQP